MRMTLLTIWVFVLLPVYTARQSLTKLSGKLPFQLHISNKLTNPLPVTPAGSILDTNAIKKGSWYADVVKNIGSAEYEIKKDYKTGLYIAPNRKQQLRATFNYNSFTLQPRIEEGGWKLKMRLCGIYAGKKLIVQPGEKDQVVTGSNKIVFTNPDLSTEYINSNEGIRQNFIIQKEPASKTRSINIKLSIGSCGQTNKGWFINKVHDKELHFAKVDGDQLSKKITYNSLKVWDANNKELDAKFLVNKKHDAFEIEVNTENAVYPITIDPISTGTAGTPDWIGDDADQAGANFGINVASAGDVNGDGYSDVIVGAFLYDDLGNTDEGRAFVYHGSATGLSATPNSILDDADQAGAFFGVCVNTAGDVNADGYSDVIIAASSYDDAGNANEGRAFIYQGSAAGLSASPSSIIDDVNQPDAILGYVNAAASAGDVNGDGYSDVIVGAQLYDEGSNANEGVALVYYGSSTGISASPDAVLDDANQAEARFGSSVASAGDVNGDGYSDVIIGAQNYSDNFSSEGAAFIYYGSSSGLSASPDSFLDDANQTGAVFGFIVNSCGDVNGDGYSDVIIGAFGYDDGTNTNEGAAFVYHGSSTGVSASPDVIIDDADQINAGLGIRAASAGDVNGDGYSDVIVGIYFYDDGTNTNEGRALIYFGSATGLPATPNAILDDGDLSFGELGSGACSAGDVNGDGYSDVIVGLWHYTEGANSQEGRAFVYHGGPDGLKTTATWTAEGNQANAYFGVCVSSAGDVNSDGYSDVIIGAWMYDNGETDEGRAYVYYGSSSGLSATANWSAEANQANARFGVNASSAGDVNGDGYSDIIIAATGFDNGETDEGRAFVYHGSASGLSLTPNWTAESNQAFAGYGVGVRNAGDINADGYSDVIVGAPWFDNGQNDEGGVFVYHGSASGLSATANWTAESNQSNAYMGFNMGSAGDVNGDGYSDIIVGAAQYSNGESAEGRAFVYHGSATGLSIIANWIAESNQAFADFGINVSSAGDVNGDGYSDIIVGAENYTNGETSEGKAFVYHGSATGLSLTANWTAESNQSGANFGFGVSSAGDVNGDGYSDVIVGCHNYNNGESMEGRAFVYHGSATGLSVAANWTAESNQAGAQFGTHSGVACAGDINGDGYSDIIVSSWFYDNGETDEGKVFVYYGNVNGGLRNNLRLYNTDLVTPIQRFNMLEPNLFGAGLFSRSPVGRVKGKLVWEVKQQGQPFSGNPITNSTSFLGKQPSFTDLGIAGTELKYNVQKQGLQNKIRVRVEYDKVTAITGQVYGPWRYPSAYLHGAHGMNSIPLPVKLNSFTGALVAGKVDLQWRSSFDEYVATYQIERSSNNMDFTTIGNVRSIHLNNNNYNYTDDHPLNGKSWYRLKISDEHGGINYSGIIIIKNTTGAVAVYPTMISKGERVTLQFKNNITGAVEIRLMNSGGAVVFKKAMTPNGNKLLVELPSLSSGVYILSAIQNGESLITQKIIIR